MRQELLELWYNFLEEVEKVNTKEYRESHNRVFEDRIEPTFENFMKWLEWEERGDTKTKE